MTSAGVYDLNIRLPHNTLAFYLRLARRGRRLLLRGHARALGPLDTLLGREIELELAVGAFLGVAVEQQMSKEKNGEYK